MDFLDRMSPSTCSETISTSCDPLLLTRDWPVEGILITDSMDQSSLHFRRFIEIPENTMMFWKSM